MLGIMDLARFVIESASAVICFILLWFMLKPYRITGDNRFLGLPLGFGVMGVSHIIATVVTFSQDLSWFMLLFRTFSFVFLATTYFFSSRSSKKTQQLWNTTVSVLIVILITLALLVFVSPQTVLGNSNSAEIYFRVFMEIFLTYIILYTLRTHVQKPDPWTLWIPFGFIFLALSQYAFLLYYVEPSPVTLWSAVAFRFAGLVVFLVVAYQTFYRYERNANNEVTA